MNASIHVSHLSHYYGKTLALEDINFEINRGDTVALLGANGAGKSTLLKLLAGILPILYGEAAIHGISLTENAQQARALIGYLGEMPPIHKDVSPFNYLTFCAKLRRIPKTDITSRLEETLYRCGLTKYAHFPIQALSKGYQQRVGIAQAIIHNPRVLILDEPTASLDHGQINSFRELIKSLGEHFTVLIATHLLSDVTSLCDRIILLKNRKIDFNKTVSTILKDNATDHVELAFSNPPDLQELEAIEGVSRVNVQNNNRFQLYCDDKRKAMNQILLTSVKKDWEIQDILQNESTLTEILQAQIRTISE